VPRSGSGSLLQEHGQLGPVPAARLGRGYSQWVAQLRVTGAGAKPVRTCTCNLRATADVQARRMRGRAGRGGRQRFVQGGGEHACARSRGWACIRPSGWCWSSASIERFSHHRLAAALPGAHSEPIQFGGRSTTADTSLKSGAGRLARPSCCSVAWAAVRRGSRYRAVCAVFRALGPADRSPSVPSWRWARRPGDQACGNAVGCRWCSHRRAGRRRAGVRAIRPTRSARDSPPSILCVVLLGSVARLSSAAGRPRVFAEVDSRRPVAAATDHNLVDASCGGAHE